MGILQCGLDVVIHPVETAAVGARRPSLRGG
jgi:hypothetical protein